MFVWGLLLFDSLARLQHNFDSYLQPGHVNLDYDSVEEVKSHNDTTTEKTAVDEHLIQEAILDVGYYLRRFKFSGFDPRFLGRNDQPIQNLFAEFPNPQLKNIHWEVKKNCEPSFVECVKYLQEKVSQTNLPRHLDSLTIARRNGWTLVTDRDLIKSADDECLKLLQTDENTYNVFSSSLQRFQWLTSASYYMCWYTMKENHLLKTFSEDCDDFASCLSWDHGFHNMDARADNTRPFACAQYSFCPDPCCPLKHIGNTADCKNASPCSGLQNKDCEFLRNNNADFEALMLNQWNVTCQCDQGGMRWESKSGMCVDVDECADPKFPCSHPSESCTNLPGSFKCVCSILGYRGNNTTGACEEDPLLRKIFDPSKPAHHNVTNTSMSNAFVGRIKSAISVAWNQVQQLSDKKGGGQTVP